MKKKGDDEDLKNANDEESDRQPSMSGTGTKSKVSGQLALFNAVQNNDLKAVKQAIKDQSANLNLVDDYGWTPLRKAARNGSVEIALYLLDNGATVSSEDLSVLITAASWGRTEVLSLVLDRKANISGISQWDTSPLVVAAQNGHIGVIKVLIEAGADVNQQDSHNNDALMTAWNYGRAHIVRYLVENGAQLKKQEDWARLAQSPATALNIADGTADHMVKVSKLIEMGEQRSSDQIKLEVPLNALCAWIRQVPQAAMVLLDKVLLRKPDDAPMRATLPKNILMNTRYLEVNDWLPKEEPALFSLAPKDMGSGCAVLVKVVQQRGILNTHVFFSLASARRQVFRSIVVTGMLEHAWNYVIEIRYRIDIFFEILTVIALALWTVEDKSAEFRFLGIAFVGVTCLADVSEEFRQLAYHKQRNESYYSNLFSSTGASVFRVFRIFCSLLLIVLIIEMQIRFNNTPPGAKLPPVSIEFYKIILSVVIMTRWFRLLSFINGYSIVGPYILPIIKCTANLVYWFLVAGVIIFASFHAVGVLLLDYNTVGRMFVSIFTLVALQRYDEADWFSRQDYYAMEASVYKPVVEDDIFFIFQTVWFLLLAFFAGTVLFDILIAVVADSFDIEQQQSWITFLQERTDIAFTYYLAIEESHLSPTEMILGAKKDKKANNSERHLWMCAEIDEETHVCVEIEKLMWSGRLGKLAHFMEETVNMRYNEMCERLDAFEEALTKKIFTFNQTLKNAKKDIIAEISSDSRKIEELSN